MISAGRAAARKILNSSQPFRLMQPSMMRMVGQPRYFAQAVMSAEQMAEEQRELEMADENTRLGVDTEFSTQKHAYVLTFPWNFEEIINDFESRHRGVSSGFWGAYLKNSECMVKFNELFREFHQACARNDPVSVDWACEARLAKAVNESLDRIHFHGLDIEMANLTVTQPSIKVLKVEVSHGLKVDRASNGQAQDWNVTQSSLFGAPCTYYTPANDTRDCIDGLDEDHRPYCVAVTTVIESPMKLFVQNQNYSKILLGSDNEELVKNVVRFEANLRW